VLANLAKRVDRDAKVFDPFDETQWQELVLSLPPLDEGATAAPQETLIS
jgi:hypothetical protein